MKKRLSIPRHGLSEVGDFPADAAELRGYQDEISVVSVDQVKQFLTTKARRETQSRTWGRLSESSSSRNTHISNAHPRPIIEEQFT